MQSTNQIQTKQTLPFLSVFPEGHLDSLREDLQYLTENLMKKTMQHVNKQLQDTLMNYFLENYISQILKKKMDKPTNRAVREALSQNLSEDLPKYMALLSNYEQKMIEFGIDEEYSQLLIELIMDKSPFQKHGDAWKTHTRKKMLAVLLYVHWKYTEKKDELDTFFELWKVVYPSDPLPQRIMKRKEKKYRQKKEHKQNINLTGNEDSTQVSVNGFEIPAPRKIVKTSSSFSIEKSEDTSKLYNISSQIELLNSSAQFSPLNQYQKPLLQQEQINSLFQPILNLNNANKTKSLAYNQSINEQISPILISQYQKHQEILKQQILMTQLQQQKHQQQLALQQMQLKSLQNMQNQFLQQQDTNSNMSMYIQQQLMQNQNQYIFSNQPIIQQQQQLQPQFQFQVQQSQQQQQPQLLIQPKFFSL